MPPTGLSEEKSHYIHILRGIKKKENHVGEEQLQIQTPYMK